MNLVCVVAWRKPDSAKALRLPFQTVTVAGTFLSVPVLEQSFLQAHRFGGVKKGAPINKCNSQKVNVISKIERETNSGPRLVLKGCAVILHPMSVILCHSYKYIYIFIFIFVFVFVFVFVLILILILTLTLILTLILICIFIFILIFITIFIFIFICIFATPLQRSTYFHDLAMSS